MKARLSAACKRNVKEKLSEPDRAPCASIGTTLGVVMKAGGLAAAGVAMVCMAGGAWAQGDPCAPQGPTLFGALVARQRAEACAAERQAQWQHYYDDQAKMRAQQQADDARAAAAASIQAEADAARGRRVQKAEADRQNVERAQEIARIAVESARITAEERAKALRDQADAREEARVRYVAYQKMVAAEASPENRCKMPSIARQVLSEWNEFDRFKAENLKAVDIEHLTTVRFDPDAGVVSCHGIFVTTEGPNIVGTFSTKKNVAGDIISNWAPDNPQDLSSYEAPPDPDPIQDQATSSVQTIPAAMVSVQPAAPAASDPFSSGLADRRQWEAWLAGLAGSEREGAVWWASNRNAPRHGACGAAAQKDDAAWEAGCMNALAKLAPIDAKRRADPLYRKGWNSL